MTKREPVRLSIEGVTIIVTFDPQPSGRPQTRVEVQPWNGWTADQGGMTSTICTDRIWSPRTPSVKDVTVRHDDGLMYAHVVCPHCGSDTTHAKEGHVYTGTLELFRCFDCRKTFPIYTETDVNGVSTLRIGSPKERVS